MSKIISDSKLERILEKAYNKQILSRAEIVFLLGLNEEQHINRLFEVARELRYRFFANKVFLYGFVYFSTWCRNDCNFCYYRKSNNQIERYRKTTEEVLEAAQRLKESGVHLIDLTMGEDPFYYQKQNGFEPLVNLVSEVKKQTNLPVMVSPGIASKQALKAFAGTGADWYACYQEIHNRELFSRLRPDQSYDQRITSKKFANQAGLLTEEGILVGVGESLEDIAISMENMRILDTRQVRVMSFVPQEGIPLASHETPSRALEFKVIAVLRLLFPDRLIPASLDVDGIEGMQERINAGANVVTSLIPPRLGFMGVAQCNKDINEGYRTVQGVTPYLEKMDLSVATLDEYIHWIETEKSKIKGDYIQVEG